MDKSKYILKAIKGKERTHLFNEIINLNLKEVYKIKSLCDDIIKYEKGGLKDIWKQN